MEKITICTACKKPIKIAFNKPNLFCCPYCKTKMEVFSREITVYKPQFVNRKGFPIYDCCCEETKEEWAWTIMLN